MTDNTSQNIDSLRYQSLQSLNEEGNRLH